MRFSSRTLILVLVAVVLAILVVVTTRRLRTSPTVEVSSSVIAENISPEELRVKWKKGVEEALTRYREDEDATAVRDRLLALRVAANDRALHLKLVLAAQALADKKKDGEKLMQSAELEFNKLLEE